MKEISTPRAQVTSTFRSQSVEILRDLILSGGIPSGSRLNEADLARHVGISRGPLREAVRELAAEGLLVSIPGKGAFVKDFSDDELTKLYELRVALETYAVSTLSDDIDVTSLRHASEEARGLIEDDKPSYSKDMEFHSALVALTGNPFLVDAARAAHRQITLAGSEYGYDAIRARLATDEHARILSSLERGSRDEALLALTEHLHSTLERALAAMHEPHAHSSRP